VPLSDFQGRGAGAVTELIFTDLILAGRKLERQACLFIIDMEWDVLLGERFFDHHQIDISASTNRLIWLDRDRTVTPLFANPPQTGTAGYKLRIEHITARKWDRQEFLTKRGERCVVTLSQVTTRIAELKADPHDRLRKLPRAHRQWAHVFSAEKAKQLPPSRSADVKIRLHKKLPERTAPLYKMTLEQLEFIRDYIKENLANGFIVPSEAPFSSPVLLVHKGNGKFRFCVDYRTLNSHTIRDAYPLPLFDETQNLLSGKKWFSKLDIIAAFNKLRMDPESEDLTTFKTRYGSYKYRVMPFGITNGPANFQRYINNALQGLLDDICLAYIDDILIFSETKEEHEKHLNTVLQRLADAGLQCDIDKSEFYTQRTKFLGFIVTDKGVEMDPAKIQTIIDWGTPRRVSDVRSFLGFCNFYRKFISDYSTIVRPLNRLTGERVTWRWGPEEKAAFQDLKDAIITGPVLAYYDPRRETRMETDASDGVAAGVLCQRQDDGEFHPIAFYSKTLDDTQTRYEIHDKEMLAVILGIREWNSELMGLQQPATFVTDHRALEYFTTKQRLNSRQARWLDDLSPLAYTITY
jgi:hypothetical protein